MTQLAETTLALLLMTAMLCASGGAQAAEEVAAFTVQPERCIALNRGQVCYQKLTFQWQAAAGARYCLYQDAVAAPLVCWNGNERNSHEVEFESDRNIMYGIRLEGQSDNLAQVEVEVAWVYQSNRNGFSRWRLF
jgi:hypothetical protein